MDCRFFHRLVPEKKKKTCWYRRHQQNILQMFIIYNNNKSLGWYQQTLIYCWYAVGQWYQLHEPTNTWYQVHGNMRLHWNNAMARTDVFHQLASTCRMALYLTNFWAVSTCTAKYLQHRLLERAIIYWQLAFCAGIHSHHHRSLPTPPITSSR